MALADLKTAIADFKMARADLDARLIKLEMEIKVLADDSVINLWAGDSLRRLARDIQLNTPGLGQRVRANLKCLKRHPRLERTYKAECRIIRSFAQKK